ncbi:MAG: hypothetical protein ACREMU_01080 [Gemmatimonadaceae bacterium]
MGRTPRLWHHLLNTAAPTTGRTTPVLETISDLEERCEAITRALGAVCAAAPAEVARSMTRLRFATACYAEICASSTTGDSARPYRRAFARSIFEAHVRDAHALIEQYAGAGALIAA